MIIGIDVIHLTTTKVDQFLWAMWITFILPNTSDYGGIKQKWVMVNSEYLKERELKSFKAFLRFG